MPVIFQLYDSSLTLSNDSIIQCIRNYGKHVIRLSIGLEETKDLIEDLEQAFKNL